MTEYRSLSLSTDSQSFPISVSTSILFLIVSSFAFTFLLAPGTWATPLLIRSSTTSLVWKLSLGSWTQSINRFAIPTRSGNRSIEQRELVDFVYETAARVGEAIGLDYEDVHEGHVVLYSRKNRNSAKLPRFVPRPSFIKPNGKGKVFKMWNAYPRFLEDKVEECKQPKWNWHGLRHRRASIWAHEGKPLFELQMLLGHTQISTTQRYLHSLGIVRF